MTQRVETGKVPTEVERVGLEPATDGLTNRGSDRGPPIPIPPQRHNAFREIGDRMTLADSGRFLVIVDV